MRADRSQAGGLRDRSIMTIVTETSTGSFSHALLGRTGRAVSRLGVSASYGVPGEAVERAFEQGVNYLYWGSMRRDSFGAALRRLGPRRDEFVLVVQSYTRAASLMSWSLERALRALRFDYTDVLLLGMWNRPVAPRILDAAKRLKARGLVRFLAVSTHTRTLVPAIAAGRDFDIIHFRYNAAHPGAEADIFPHLPDAGRPGLVAFTATSWGQLLGKAALQGIAGSRSLPKGERDSHRRRLLSLRADTAGSGCVHDGSEGRGADGARARSAAAGADERRRGRMDAARRPRGIGKVGAHVQFLTVRAS